MTQPQIDHAASARTALDRTLLLMRDEIQDETSDELLLAALLETRVLIVADTQNANSPLGQDAIVCAGLLSARSGATVWLDMPNAPLLGPQLPLARGRLLDVLVDVGSDLIPTVPIAVGRPREQAHVAIVVGDTPWRGRAELAVRLTGDAWKGIATAAAMGGASRWQDQRSPFGALAAAGLGATEAFKSAMRRLSHHAKDRVSFDALFAPTYSAQVRLAPDGTPAPTPELGSVDVISAGAIAQATLFALSRIPAVRGKVRVIEPDTSDLTNLNRNAFLRRRRAKLPKARDLAELCAQTGLSLEPVLRRFDDGVLAELSPLARSVLVGVDDIPTRWAVQRARPEWIGVGATGHFDALTTFHTSGMACAWCAHPTNAVIAGNVPTAAFISHWAGIRLAALFARRASGFPLRLSEQSVYSSVLRLGSRWNPWCSPVHFRTDCPMKCEAAA